MSQLSAVLILSLVLCLSVAPSFAVAREQVNSYWILTPPTIDGKFEKVEWSNLQIVMKKPAYPIEAYAYFQNDASNLYVLVDSAGDTTDRESMWNDDYDECLLVFNFDNPMHIQIVGYAGTKENQMGFVAAIGFGDSPNSPRNHKIYEFSIPLRFIRANLGQSIDFCSPKKRGRSISYDASDGSDNIWPSGLVYRNRETWGILVIGQATTTVTSETTAKTTTMSSETATKTSVTAATTKTQVTTPTASPAEPVPLVIPVVIVAIALVGAAALLRSRSKRRS